MNSKENSTGLPEASSAVVLTLKGERYCREQEQKEQFRTEAERILDQCLDMAEKMIRFLDLLDGDADLEPDLDGEEDDPAEDNGDREPDGDDELNHQPLTLHRAGGAA